MGLLPPVIVEMRANASELMSKLGEVQSKVEETASKGASHFDKLKAAIGPATIAIGGTVTAAAALAEHLAEPIEQARKQLEAAFTAAGSSVEEYRDQIAKTDKQMENFGHSQSDAENALRILTAATQDPTKALNNMQLVANIAAARHISLADASDLLARGLSGSTRIFREFGITVKKNKDGTADMTDAMSQLTQHLQGQASAAVDTFGGRIEVIKTKVEDWVGVHATKLIPILTATGPALAGVGGIISSGVIPAVVKAIAAMGGMIVQAGVWMATMIASAVTAVASWVASMAVMAASAIAAGVAMLLPFLPIIAVLAAVGVAAYLLYRNWDTVFGFVKQITADVVGWVSDHLSLIIDVALGPLGVAINLLRDHWSEVWGFVSSAVEDAWSIIKPIFDAIIRAVDDVVSAVGKVTDTGGKIVGGIERVGHDLHIPGMASGGIVNRPTLALIGEAGPEAVVPLGQSMNPGMLGGGGGTTVVINMAPGTIVGTAQQVADALLPHVVNALNKGARRGTSYTTALNLS